MRSGGFEQDYMPPVTKTAKKTKGKNADWFDGNADQYDAFGRPRARLSQKAVRNYVERVAYTRNVTLGCSKPGCAATGILKVLFFG